MGYTAEYATTEPARADIDKLVGPVLVEFGAPWCPYCQAIQPTLQEMLESRPEVQHIKIYDGRGKPLGRSFRVKLWPNLVFMRDGTALVQLARPPESSIRDGFRRLSEPEA